MGCVLLSVSVDFLMCLDYYKSVKISVRVGCVILGFD